jgi:hypothetical protein
VIACPECEKQVSDQAPPCASGGRPIMSIPGAGPSRRVAAILSFIIPGLGQMYLGRVGRGFVYLLATAFCYAAVGMLSVDANRMGEPRRNGGIIGVFMLLALAIPLVSTCGAALARPKELMTLSTAR